MKTLRPAIVLTVFFLVVTGLIFPGLITLVAQAAFNKQANGSMVLVDGKPVGSSLIGQPFTSDRYFHPRPSAAGAGYDANNSSGTNLGPTNPKLLEGVEGFDGIKQLSEAYRTTNSVAADVVLPADAVTRSASGLDPHISLRNAELQMDRVAKSRNLEVGIVRNLIREHSEAPALGVFGDERVNVLRLNLALDSLEK